MSGDSQVDRTGRVDRGLGAPFPGENAENDLTLCLSGGGYRAAVYHLGVTRRLHELGILQQVRRISCVSGGSIIGAFLLQRYPAFQGQTMIGFDWEEQIEEPFRRLVCGCDLRTWPVLRRWGLAALFAVMTLAWTAQAGVAWAHRPLIACPAWGCWLLVAGAAVLILTAVALLRGVGAALLTLLVLVGCFVTTAYVWAGAVIVVVGLVAIVAPFLTSLRWGLVCSVSLGGLLALELWGVTALPQGREPAIWILLNGLLTSLAGWWAIRKPSLSVESLRELYVKHLLKDQEDVPLDEVVPQDRPLAFCFNATDIIFGARWVAERHRHRGKYQHRVGSYRAGYGRFEGKSPLPPERRWSLARAVAASSCFPPVFGPMKVDLAASDYQGTRYLGFGRTESDREADRNRKLSSMMVNDGGNYGNLGLLAADGAPLVVVSDGGAPLTYAAPESPFQLLGRYTGLLMAVNVNQRVRELIKALKDSGPAGKEGLFVRMGRRLDNAQTPDVLSRQWNAKAVAEIRTDLAPLTRLEFQAAEELGYVSVHEKIECFAGDVAPFRKRAPLNRVEVIEDPQLARRLCCRNRLLLAPWLRSVLSHQTVLPVRR
jgi:predicted acylesterase/phospholipase RssA